MDDINMLPQLKQHINGLNLYIYANNNPVNLYDPDGRIFRWIWRNVVRPITNVIGAGIELMTTIVMEAPSFIGGVLGGASNLLLGTNFYDLTHWQMHRGYRIGNAWNNFIDAWGGTYQTSLWRNIENSFWNGIGWLNDSLGNTLEILSQVGAIGLWAKPLVGVALLIIGGIAGIIRILNDLRPNQTNLIL